MAEVITVSALNRYVKSLFDANDRLFDLALCGEVANFVQNARSGHCYFTLRDEQVPLGCAAACVPSGRGNACGRALPCNAL
mgnify:CR=1 FL=1